MPQWDPGQFGAFLNPEGYDLLLAVRKRFHACCGRELEDPGDFFRHDIVRVQGKGQIHGFFQQFQVFHIFRIAKDRDGMICPEFFGQPAGQQIRLVKSGGRNEDIGSPGLRLGQGFQCGTVPAAADHVQAAYRDFQTILPLIDDGNVVPLQTHLTGNCHADLSGPGDHDLHEAFISFPPMYHPYYGIIVLKLGLNPAELH